LSAWLDVSGAGLLLLLLDILLTLLSVSTYIASTYTGARHVSSK
jgi:hypothetical protein